MNDTAAPVGDVVTPARSPVPPRRRDRYAHRDLDAAREFAVGRAGPGDMTVSGRQADPLAWLLGRSDGRPLRRKPDGPLPATPAMY